MRSFLFLAAIFLLVPLTSLSAQGRAAVVGVEAVEMRALSETVPVFAEVVTARDGSVASRVAGNVEQVHVLAGSQVIAGDLLVELNRDLLTIIVAQSEAELQEATARINSARARLNRAETAFQRTNALQGSTSFSQGRFDDAQADLAEARADLIAAEAREAINKARLEESRYNLERSEIRAPFAGTVIDVVTIPGAFIQAGTPVLRMIDTTSFEIEASVPGRYISGLSAGQVVQATTPEGQQLGAKVRAILPLEDAATRTRAVRFIIEETDQAVTFAAGESLTLEIPIGATRDILSVPKDALVQSRSGWTVYVVEDDMAQPRNVQIGVAIGNRYEVVSGLAPGDLAVVRGNERLRPGQAVTAMPSGTN